MADGTYGYHAIRLALQGRWEEINYGSLRQTIHDYSGGTDSVPGSENYGTLAYGAALAIWWKGGAHRLAERLGLTPKDLRAWWADELRTRLRKGLQLNECDSRIYMIFSVLVICLLYRAFKALGGDDLMDLHRRYVRANAAQIALCGFPVRPVRLDPAEDDNAWKHKIAVPITGARSWGRGAHHMLHCGYELLAAHLLGITWTGGGSQDQWASEVIRLAKPGWMGLTSSDVSIFRSAVRSGDTELVSELVGWLGGVGTMWPSRLIRFERGSACLHIGKGVNGNTAPVHHMAIHRDGTVHYVQVHDGEHYSTPPGTAGVNETDYGDGGVKYVAWAEGPKGERELVLHPDRWVKVLWDVHLKKDGNHIVHRPSVETPVPPGPGPEPEKPRDDESWLERHKVQVIFGAIFLVAVVGVLRGCW